MDVGLTWAARWCWRWTVALLALWGCARPPAGAPEPAAPVDTHGSPTGDTAYVLADTGEMDPFTGPWTLSETGLYADVATRTLAPDVQPWTPAWPLWSDGAEKQRYIRIPEGERIDTSDPDRWIFPVGTEAWKAFTRDGVLVETRYLAKGPDGWTMVAYVWRDDGTDADAVPAGLSDARGTPHDVPSRADCQFCHGATSDVLAGFDAIQLGVGSPTATYETLVAEDRVTVQAEPADVPGSGAAREALGYLHGNCSNCHVDGSVLDAQTPLRLGVAVGLSTPEETAAYRTAIGTPAVHVIEGTSTIVVPGAPEQSQLWVRMGQRGLQGMPPRGTEEPDAAGLDTVAAWIRDLPLR